jgi:thioredoxin-related protein
MNFIFPFAMAFLIGVPTASISAADSQTNLVYTADRYDPSRDPKRDLADSIALAKRDGRHIVLLVGGDWCPWCRKLASFIEDNAAVSALLTRDYVIMKVNVSDETSNTGFLNPYPAIEAFPHLFLLDAEGKLLQSQETEVFEKSGSYDEAALAAVLEKHRPKRKG